MISPLHSRNVFVLLTVFLTLTGVALEGKAQSQRLFEAFVGGKSGLIDEWGNWVLRARFDSIDAVKNHRIYFYRDSLLGIANMRGKVLVPPRWHTLLSETPKLALAADKNGFTYLNINNAKRICSYYRDLNFFWGGMATVQDSTGKWGAIDADGVLRVPCRYDSLDDYGAETAQAWRGGRPLLVDRDGQELDGPAPDLRWRSHFMDLTFYKDGKRGALNERGDTVFKPVYDYLSCFLEGGTRTFCRDGKCGVIDTLGNLVIRPKYDYLRRYYGNNLLVAALSGKWGLIDAKENSVLPFEYDRIEWLADSFFAASKAGKWGVLCPDGRWVLRPEFERIRSAFTDEDEEEERFGADARGTARYYGGVPSPMLLTAPAGLQYCPGAVSGEGDAGAEVRVVPNVSSGRFVVESQSEGPASYRIYDGKGAAVKAGNLAGPATGLDISLLPAAVYTLVVSSGEKQHSVRITKR